MISTWKKIKRSGNFRRKVKTRLENMMHQANNKSIIDIDRQINGNVLENFILRSTTSTDVSSGNISDLEVDNAESIGNGNRQQDKEVFDSDEEAVKEVRDHWCTELQEEEGEEQIQENRITELEKDLVVRSRIRRWATSFRINHMALKEMLSIWNERLPNIMPADPRTLLNTPRQIVIRTLDYNGLYWHQGLHFCIEKLLRNLQHVPSTISLNINVDGLPVYKSSKQEFWPILVNIHELPTVKPMVVGIYSGYGKPKTVQDFLNPLVTELEQILKYGLMIKGFKLSISVRCFICDSPARAFIKGKIIVSMQ